MWESSQILLFLLFLCLHRQKDGQILENVGVLMSLTRLNFSLFKQMFLQVGFGSHHKIINSKQKASDG